MTTIRAQLEEAAATAGDDPSKLICYFMDVSRSDISYRRGITDPPIQHGTIEDLPAWEFSAGYGGVNGPPLIAFSKRYVYVQACYDGQEWVEAVPRHPKYATFLPSLGGG